MLPDIKIDSMLNWAIVGVVLTVVLALVGAVALMNYVFQHVRFI